MQHLRRATTIASLIIIATMLVRSYVRFGLIYISPSSHHVVVIANPSRPLPRLDAGKQKLRQTPPYTLLHDAALPYTLAIIACGGLSIVIAALTSRLRRVLQPKQRFRQLLSAQTLNNTLVLHRRPPPVDYACS